MHYVMRLLQWSALSVLCWIANGLENNDDFVKIITMPFYGDPPTASPIGKPKPKPKPITNPVVDTSIVKEWSLWPINGTSYQKFGQVISVYNATFGVGCTNSASIQSVNIYCFDREISSQTRLLANIKSKSIFDGFGTSLAIDDYWILVGAKFDSYNAFESGVVHCYSRYDSVHLITCDLELSKMKASQNQTSQVFMASDFSARSRFGCSLNMLNGHVLIGAEGDSTQFDEAGSVYLFALGNNSWNEKRKFLAHDAAPFAHYGCSVFVTSLWLVVGACDDSWATPRAGAVYIYESAAASASTMPATKLTPSLIYPNSHFGHVISFQDEIGFVSAYQLTGAGLVYVYARHLQHGPVPLNSWLQVAMLFIPNSAMMDEFGASLSYQLINTPLGAEEVLVVGAPVDSMCGLRAGAVTVFGHAVGNVSDWSILGKFCSANAHEFDGFGSSVAVMGTHVVVGAELSGQNANLRTGAVYVEEDMLTVLLSERDEQGQQSTNDQRTSGSQLMLQEIKEVFATSFGLVLCAVVASCLITVAVMLCMRRRRAGQEDAATSGASVNALFSVKRSLSSFNMSGTVVQNHNRNPLLRNSLNKAYISSSSRSNIHDGESDQMQVLIAHQPLQRAINCGEGVDLDESPPASDSAALLLLPSRNCQTSQSHNQLCTLNHDRHERADAGRGGCHDARDGPSSGGYFCPDQELFMHKDRSLHSYSSTNIHRSQSLLNDHDTV